MTNDSHSASQNRLAYKRVVKLIHFEDFLKLFFGVDALISLITVSSVYFGLFLFNDRSQYALAAMSTFLFCAACSVACFFIYMRERSARLYFKTAYSAYAIFMAVSTLIAYLSNYFILCKDITIWFFEPLRLFRFFLGMSNLKSVFLSHGFMIVLIPVAYFASETFCKKRSKHRY